MMIEKGIDPLIENEEGEDLMMIAKQQYNFLGTELKKMQQFIVDASRVVIEPSVLEQQARVEDALLNNYDKLSEFASSMEASLADRIQSIKNDQLVLRAYALKNEVCLLSLSAIPPPSLTTHLPDTPRTQCVECQPAGQGPAAPRGSPPNTAQPPD